jgi:glycosyltransferase involved in cell wall biosynthesis
MARVTPRLLLVTMYYPPAAGGGVQRAVKLAAHLPDLGIETHVLTPDDAKWLQRDPAAVEPVAAIVHRFRNLAPAARLRSRELHGKQGVRRLAMEARLLFRRMLVPDPEVVWSLPASYAAARIIRRRGIHVVVTTSPPDSVHLTGAIAQRVTGARWIADLRESPLSSPFRRRELRGERRLASLVARRADAVVAVTEPIAEELRRLRAHDTEVIPNGCDPEDFAGLSYRAANGFRITHTGSFHGGRQPSCFLDALARVNGEIVARFVGDFPDAAYEHARQVGVVDRIESFPFLPRRQALALQRDSEALLLLVADRAGRGNSVATGKLYEYLVAGRPILAVAPLESPAANLIRETGAGVVVAPDDVDGIAAALTRMHGDRRRGELMATTLPPAIAAGISRRAGAERFAEVVRRLL